MAYESPAAPSVAYIGGRSCLVLMEGSYNANLDKKKTSGLYRRSSVFAAKITMISYDAVNLP
jgi:hypothetical protein